MCNQATASPSRQPSNDPPERKRGKKLPPIAKNDKYKTKLCRNYMETGLCKYGRVCQFAHGWKELNKYSFHFYYMIQFHIGTVKDGTITPVLSSLLNH